MQAAWQEMRRSFEKEHLKPKGKSLMPTTVTFYACILYCIRRVMLLYV